MPDWHTDGFALLPGLLTAEAVERLRADVAAVFGKGTADGPHGILRHNPWRRLPVFAEVLGQGHMARRLCQLIDSPRLRLFQDNLVWKPPGVETGIAWHQDYAYWPLAAPDGVTLWVALDDADADNGCLRYLPGSHREGERAAPGFVEGAAPAAASALPPIRIAGREAEAVAMAVRAGDGIAHHPLVLHTSSANRSRRQRRAWSLSFVAEDARWCPAHAPHPFNHQLAPADGDVLSGELFPVFEA